MGGLPGDGLYTGGEGGGHGYTILPGNGRYHMYDTGGGHMVAVSEYNRRRVMLMAAALSTGVAILTVLIMLAVSWYRRRRKLKSR